MSFFYQINKDVLPLKANLAIQAVKLEAAQAELNMAQATLDEKQAELDTVQAIYADAMRYKQYLHTMYHIPHTTYHTLYYHILYYYITILPYTMYHILYYHIPCTIYHITIYHTATPTLPIYSHTKPSITTLPIPQ